MSSRSSIARIAIVLALLGAPLPTGPAHAQIVPPSATQPVTDLPPLANESLERRAVGSSGTTAAGTTTTTTPAPQPRSLAFDFGRMMVALAIVLGLIFGTRWLVAHFFVGARAPATSKAIKVLGRTSLAPRQQVLLLQVGRRVVVVGESNGQLMTLAQLDDPDEVASLIGQLQEEQMQRAAAFGGIFGRVQKRFSGESDEDDEHAPREISDLEGNYSGSSVSEPSVEPANDSQAKSELAGLVDKVRAIRDQLGRSGDGR